jgi:hypothetical protein
MSDKTARVISNMVLAIYYFLEWNLKAIKKDLQANGIPDISLVTDPKFIPDLIKALADHSSNTKAFFGTIF